MAGPGKCSTKGCMLDVSVVADVLLKALCGECPPYPAVADFVARLCATPATVVVPPTILEALARLTVHEEEAVSRESAHALVLLSSRCERTWIELVDSGSVSALPFVSRVVADASFWRPDGQPWRLASDLRALCCGSAAEKIACHGDGRRTPLSIACGVLLRDLENARGYNGPGSEAVKENAQGSFIGCLSMVLNLLDATSWNYVCDDDVVDIVYGVASSTADEGLARQLIEAPPLIRRYLAFNVETPAAGRLYAIIASGDGQRFRGAFDALRGWSPSMKYPGFSYGYVSGRSELEGASAIPLESLTSPEEFVALFNTRNDTSVQVSVLANSDAWWADESRAPLLAAAYITAPDSFRERVTTCPAVIQAVLGTRISLRGPVDEALESAIRSLLSSFEGVISRTSAADFPTTRAPGAASGIGTGLGVSEAENSHDSAMRLRRLALAHPSLVMRRVPLICGALQCVVSCADPRDTDGPIAAAGILRSLVALQSGLPLQDALADMAWTSCVRTVRWALAEGRAENGVQGGFASVAIDSCNVLRGLISAGSAAHRSRWHRDSQLRTLLRDAGNATETDPELRFSIDKLFTAGGIRQ